MAVKKSRFSHSKCTIPHRTLLYLHLPSCRCDGYMYVCLYLHVCSSTRSICAATLTANEFMCVRARVERIFVIPTFRTMVAVVSTPHQTPQRVSRRVVSCVVRGDFHTPSTRPHMHLIYFQLLTGAPVHLGMSSLDAVQH